MKDDRIKETDNAPIEAEDLELISGGIFNPGKTASITITGSFLLLSRE